MTTYFTGQKLRASDLELLLGKDSPLPLGVIKRGQRITASSTTTTEVGVLRVDDVPVYAGRAYKVWTSPLILDTSVANDVARAHLRYTEDGSLPATSDTQLQAAHGVLANITSGESRVVVANYSPAADGLLSVLLSVSRVSGTGNISISASATFPIDLVVEDMGLDPGDVGVDI